MELAKLFKLEPHELLQETIVSVKRMADEQARVLFKTLDTGALCKVASRPTSCSTPITFAGCGTRLRAARADTRRAHLAMMSR